MTSIGSSSAPPEKVQEETRQLVLMWGMCCFSPVIYLSLGYFLSRPLKFDGLFPLPPELWRSTLIGAGGVAIGAQLIHAFVKHRSKNALVSARQDSRRFMKLLTRRTFILIALSELPIFIGFCLFCLQGLLTPIFWMGIASMLLYAQSHPRSANPYY